MRSLPAIKRLTLLCLSALAADSTAFSPCLDSSNQRHESSSLRSSSSNDNDSSVLPAIDERRRQAFLETAVPGPSVDTKPDYENIIGPAGKWADDLFLHLFRQELAKQVGGGGIHDDTTAPPGYDGIVELAATMNQKFTDRREIHTRAQTVLRNLFPSWMPGSYAVLFSKPFPAFSSRMNAWATKVGGTWLMGECEINTVPVDGGQMGVDQGLLVKRCRFLEESGCASVCVNSCKIPTQNFFMQDMGLPLTMEPNYETYECQFSFGRTPDATTESVAQSTPCLARCPTAGSLRKYHSSSGSGSTVATTQERYSAASTTCPFMDNEPSTL